MSTITYDGQSFIVDSRRVWLVSGAIHYPRTPHQFWRRRIRAAKEAGLNCIETYVFWNAHEPAPGRFVFEGDLDLRRFVQTVGEEGMYCILRPGPYVCAEWDSGGLPVWLQRTPDVKLREASPRFMEACSRYLGAVMAQVRDLQVTAPLAGPAPAQPAGNMPGAAAGGYTGAGGGPILMIQAENEWFCHNEEQEEKYLRELVRYLRENGCEVPINNCNNLWQRIDGTIDTWNGARRLVMDMRQLAVVQPEAPRLVTEYWPGWFDAWNAPHSTVDANLHLYRSAGILASGAQYNLYMFHGGTNFGFTGGRTVGNPACFMTTSYDYDAPLLEAGGRGAKYHATKRISTFASQFHHVFAHLEPDCTHTAVRPDEQEHPLSVIHQHGTQGDVVFVLKSERDRSQHVDVLLPDGLSLTVPLDDERAAWFVLGVNLGGIARLDYTNLRPWAFLDRKLLVLYGPAGAEGVVSIDDVPMPVRVPEGQEPLIEPHNDLVVVVLSREQVDAAYPWRGGLAIGAAGLDDRGEPTPAAGWPQMVLIGTDGAVSRRDAKPPRRPTAPRLTGWSHAPLDALIDGSADSYEKIVGPTALDDLDTPEGYGWYRIGISGAKAGQMLAPLAGDRLHLFSRGKPAGVLGLGPGATYDPVNLRLSGEVVVLADNLGRFNYGYKVGERKGLFGHLYAVKPMRLPKPKVAAERSPDPFQNRGYVHGQRRGEQSAAESLTWTIKPAGRKPIIVDVQGLAAAGMFFLNGEPLGMYHPSHSAGIERYVLEPGERGCTAGNNELKLALFAPRAKDFDPSVGLKLYQVTQVLSGRGPWAFSPWTLPQPEAFEAMPKTRSPRPVWYRCRFNVRDTDVPLWFEPRGLSKGQLYLNGHNVGRYFVATADGKAVPPQERYYLPEPWLRTEGPNELLIFEEHGRDPRRCRLAYHAMGPYGK